MRCRVAFVVVATLGAAACEPPGYGKHTGVDAAAVDGQGHAVDASIDSPAALCDQAFRLDNHASASSVWVTGDFIAWGGDPAHGAVVLMLGNDGAWTGTHQFSAGSYLYKFIVDGTQWIADPANPQWIDDGFGGKNSVYSCMP